MYEMTGCLSPCNKFEYTVTPISDLLVVQTSDPDKANTLWIGFYFTTGRHDVREQVKKALKLKYAKICVGFFNNLDILMYSISSTITTPSSQTLVGTSASFWDRASLESVNCSPIAGITRRT